MIRPGIEPHSLGSLANTTHYVNEPVISIYDLRIHICIGKSWTAVDRLTVIIKWEFFQAIAISVLLCGCTTKTLTKHLEKRLDRNYTMMLHAVLNKSWKHHPTKQQLYGYLPLIS